MSIKVKSIIRRRRKKQFKLDPSLVHRPLGSVTSTSSSIYTQWKCIAPNQQGKKKKIKTSQTGCSSSTRSLSNKAIVIIITIVAMLFIQTSKSKEKKNWFSAFPGFQCKSSRY